MLVFREIIEIHFGAQIFMHKISDNFRPSAGSWPSHGPQKDAKPAQTKGPSKPLACRNCPLTLFPWKKQTLQGNILADRRCSLRHSDTDVAVPRSEKRKSFGGPLDMWLLDNLLGAIFLRC